MQLGGIRWSVALASLCSGCVIYPTATQPGIAFHVRDEAGRPVAGATVTQVSLTTGRGAHFAGWKEARTDAEGRALIPRQTQMQVIIFAPEGPLFYNWCWCVEKPGYAPVIRNDLKKAGVRKIEQVVLKRAGPPWEATWFKPSRKFVVAP